MYKVVKKGYRGGTKYYETEKQFKRYWKPSTWQFQQVFKLVSCNPCVWEEYDVYANTDFTKQGR